MAILQIIYYSDLNGTYQSTYHLDLNTTSIYETEITKNNGSNFEQNEKKTINLLYAIAEVLQYLNHGSSFFLYSLSGEMFRNETKEFFIDIFNFAKKIFY